MLENHVKQNISRSSIFSLHTLESINSIDRVLGAKYWHIIHIAKTLDYSPSWHSWLKQGLLLYQQTMGVLHYVCVSLLIPLYPLCCSQSSAMTSLHLSWQVTVLRLHSIQQGSLNLPTICQAPKPALSCHLLHANQSDTSSLCQETVLEITI